MRKRKRLITIVTVQTLVWAGIGLWSQNAEAQSRGQVILTQKSAPENATKAALRRFLKKNRAKVLAKSDGEESYAMHVFARLRKRPSAKMLKLEHNGGKLHFEFYRKVKRRWVRAHGMQIDYAPGTWLVRFPFTITQALALKPGIRYQLRISIQNARKRAVTLASTYFKLK
jgi:hypothetical protein